MSVSVSGEPKLMEGNRKTDIMKRWVIGITMLLGGIWGIPAQEKLKIDFHSRALFDATVSGYGKESVQGYYRVEDFRIGFKASYGRYEWKADVGLGGRKVAIKDLLLNYHFRKGVLAVGNTYEPFSMDMLISTADLRFHQSAASVLAFTNSRKLGVTYHFYNEHCYLATGIYTNNDINKIGEGQKNSFVSTSRAVWRRPVVAGKGLIHLGGAFSFRSRNVNQEEPPAGNIVSDGVTSMFSAPLLEAEVSCMGTELKAVAEFLYTSPRFMFQSEFFYDRMNRTEGKEAYRSHGGYVQGGFLIKGKGFEYDAMYGIPGRPLTPQAIELVARFNYSNLNDAKSGIKGGEEKDFSLGLNYYLNQYLGMKLSASYVWVGEHCDKFYAKDFFLTQLRLQYIF